MYLCVLYSTQIIFLYVNSKFNPASMFKEIYQNCNDYDSLY